MSRTKLKFPLTPAQLEILGAAIALASCDGVPVFPCRQNKKPYTQHGFKDATRDLPTIEEMFHKHPGALIGTPTGAITGYWVVDADNHTPALNGFATLAALEQQHGKLPPTRTVRTPSGGKHLYFRWDPMRPIGSRTNAFGPGLDTRGDGGYVIAPPSILNGGTAYTWDPDSPSEIADAPDWLYRLYAGNHATEEQAPPRSTRSATSNYGRAALDREVAALANMPPHSGRNAALNNAALKLGQLIAAGELDESEAYDALLKACAVNGLLQEDGTHQCRATIDSGMRKGKTEPRDAKGPTREPPQSKEQSKPGLPYINMTNWDNEPVPEQDWSVHNRIPRRQCVLFSGQGGGGKSTINLHQACAHVLGRDWLGTRNAAPPCSSMQKTRSL